MLNPLLSLTLWIAVSGQQDVSIQYKFKPGQVLRYDAKQTMTVESTVSGTLQKSSFETNSVRQWRVLDSDDKGNARLSLTIVRVQVDATTPDGKRISFDTDQGGGDPRLADVVGKPLVEVTLSSSGKVLDVRESQAANAGQFVAHVRTLLYPLPPQPVTIGAEWEYTMTLPLPPPIGSGEKIGIRQTFRLEKMTDAVATINLRSAPAEEIKDKATLTRVAQFLPGGKIEWDLARGAIRRLDLNLDQTVTDFAGADTVMHVTGSYREVLRDELAGGGLRRQ